MLSPTLQADINNLPQTRSQDTPKSATFKSSHVMELVLIHTYSYGFEFNEQGLINQNLVKLEALQDFFFRILAPSSVSKILYLYKALLLIYVIEWLY